MRTQGNHRENAGNLILIRIWQPRNCVIEFLFNCIFLSSIPYPPVIDKMLVSILRLLAHFCCLIFNPHTASRVLSIWLPRNTGSKTYCCKFDDTRDCGVFSLWTKLFFKKQTALIQVFYYHRMPFIFCINVMYNALIRKNPSQCELTMWCRITTTTQKNISYTPSPHLLHPICLIPLTFPSFPKASWSDILAVSDV